ncbi:MAG: hypothetical protein EBS76_02165 [Actinobacteria bacterium]|nr:hypothetical protein [Actinomycetota bacterium]
MVVVVVVLVVVVSTTVVVVVVVVVLVVVVVVGVICGSKAQPSNESAPPFESNTRVKPEWETAQRQPGEWGSSVVVYKLCSRPDAIGSKSAQSDSVVKSKQVICAFSVSPCCHAGINMNSLWSCVTPYSKSTVS